MSLELSQTEILNFALQSGIIDINTIQTQIEMNERIKYLEEHQCKVWQSTDGKWYTYLPDIKFKNERKLIKRKTRKSLDDAIVQHYKEKASELTIEETFIEWVNRKLDYGEIQKQTYDRYKVDFDIYFRDSNIKNRKIRYIDDNTLEDFILDTIKSKELTSKGWANLRLLIRGTFKYAKRRGYTNFDIVNFMSYLELSKNIFRHKRKKADENVFTKNEMDQIVKYCFEKPTLSNMAVLFAAYTGMRVGEVVALKWEDITDKSIDVHSTQITYQDENGKYIHEIQDRTKTEAGMREVAIIPQLRPVLKRLKTINPFTEYIFVGEKGNIILKNTLCKNLHIICDNLGIKRRGMHVLRKTFITNMINAKVDEAIILEQVGHTEISTSKTHYYYNDKLIEHMVNQMSKAINY